MKADPRAQLQLLDLQAIDSRGDQLRHRRASLPERAEIAELQASRDEVDGERRDQQIVVDDLAVVQRKADADVEQVKARRTRDQDRMDSGAISNPKDLERMQAELVSLERRIGTLEDEELEVMEQAEEAQRLLGELTQKVSAHDERLAELASSLEAKATEIDTDLAEVDAGRAPAVDGLPEDLLALYEKLRASKGGLAAAELRARECGGCRITLDHAELGVIRGTAPEVVVRCQECDRILVRTAESGL